MALSLNSSVSVLQVWDLRRTVNMWQQSCCAWTVSIQPVLCTL